jgi:phage-related baseplate assembly protein
MEHHGMTTLRDTTTTRFSLIDPSQFPPLTLDIIPDEEVIIQERLAQFKERWTFYDPPLGAQYDVGETPFDPARIQIEAMAAAEVNIRSSLNAWGNATTLAHAWGDNLDALASRFPGAPARLNKGQPDEESDDRYRRRLWLSNNVYNTAGAAEAYLFHAVTAVPELRDVSATIERASLASDAIVVITCMVDGPDPRPSLAHLEAVRFTLARPSVAPESEVFAVRACRIIDLKVEARIWTYPGADGADVVKAAETEIAKLIRSQYYLGVDNSAEAFRAALYRPGVQEVELVNPIANVTVDEQSVVRVSGVKIVPMGTRR